MNPESSAIEQTPPALAPPKPKPKSRSKPRSRAIVKKESKPKDEPKITHWVVLWGSRDKSHRTLIGCERCGARLSFPFKSPVCKVEDAMWNFREDHQNCKEGDQPKSDTTLKDT